MPRPGVTTLIVDDFAPAGPAVNTGQGFMVGVAERGPVGVPTLVSSWRSYKNTFGSMAGGEDLYKAAYAFFNEGGLFLYVVRVAGADAVASNGTAAGWLDIEATSPGAWGDRVEVQIDPTEAGAEDTYVVTVLLDDSIVERSAPLLGPAVEGYKSSLVTLTEIDNPTYPAGADPTVTVGLSGGADGSAPTDQELAANLESITYSYGPGQVSVPGNRNAATWAALAEHCEANHRVGLVDLTDTADPAELKADVLGLASQKGRRQLLALGTVPQYPGEVSPAVWEVPYSGLQMGMVGRVDGLQDPSQVAAGSLGISRLATGIKRDFTDAEREDLNYSGVTLGKMINGQLRTYGYRTASGVGEQNWVFWQESRVVMGIAHECDAVLEEFVFKTIDGRGKIFGRVNVALTGVCQRYWQADALFGETAEEAFFVDTSYPGINTIETAAAGEIHAQVRVKTSRIAEWVTLDIVKVQLDRNVS